MILKLFIYFNFDLKIYFWVNFNNKKSVLKIVNKNFLEVNFVLITEIVLLISGLISKIVIDYLIWKIEPIRNFIS